MITVSSEAPINGVKLIDLNGNEVVLIQLDEKTFSLENVAKGSYTMAVDTENGIYFSKVIRL